MNKDLNLLRLLVVLSEEKQTTLAAKRLHVSQPTISVMLRKLREQFNDPLFVRDKNQLEPTVRCRQLLEQLPTLLDSMDSLYLDEESWDISELSGDVSLILSPPLIKTIGLSIVSKLATVAPNATIECYHWGFDALRDLELKSQCWGFSYLPMETNKNIMQKDIGDDEFVIIMRKDHPLNTTNLEDALRYPLCINLIHGQLEASQSEKIIKEFNLEKHINIRTSDVSIMLGIVESSDYLGIVSRHSVDSLPSQFRYLALPSALTDRARYRTFSLFTHQRHRINPLTNWLYKEAKALIS